MLVSQLCVEIISENGNHAVCYCKWTDKGKSVRKREICQKREMRLILGSIPLFQDANSFDTPIAITRDSGSAN